eukprot:TRINITY_DN29588_c0_g2_i1.p1 TRINITY_DN29588_c0_g2~~TRINITY_DN29588_c0_g2_i1.p1  ORF type:complete len:828 (-),score=177.37 TRINITY_DN29588_c0_g2_i1:19-2283(-)
MSKTSQVSFGNSAASMSLFPRDGEQIRPLSGAKPPPRPEVLQDIWTSMENVRSDVMQIIEAQERKLDTIFDSVSQLSDAIGKQEEASRGMEQRQHVELVEKISKVEASLEQVQKKKDMDELARRLLDKMNLPNIFDVKMTSLAESVHQQYIEAKAQRTEMMKSMGDVRDNMISTVTKSMTRVAKDMQRTQELDLEKFHVVMSQLTTVSQALNVDYVRFESVLDLGARTKEEKHASDAGSDIGSSERRGSSELRKKKLNLSTMKTFRDLGMQTVTCQNDASTQVDTSLLKGRKKKPLPPKPAVPKPAKLKEAEEIKAKARRALIKPQYNVFDQYHTTGNIQWIARSRWFENFTVCIVAINAVWMAIETDTNDALVLNEADLPFQIVENLFCSYFFMEITIRFAAFYYKSRAFMDFWFLFDSLIVLGMVAETWLVPFFIVVLDVQDTGKSLGNVSMLRTIRMVKLLRLSRISKILRSVPELVIILKAIGNASRSVFIFCGLWLVLVYFFAIIFRQITDGTQVGDLYFRTVPDCMNTLLLRGILPDFAELVTEISDPSRGNAIFGLIMTVFILFASITVMYMLVGVLVEHVSKIATEEKENLTVSYIAAKVRERLQSQGRSEDPAFSKAELQALLIDPDMAHLLISVNIDIVSLIDTLDIVYEDMSKVGAEMTFEKVIDLLLNGRGHNAATVRDTKDVLRFVKSNLKTSVEEMVNRLHVEFATVHKTLSLIRDEVLETKEYAGEVDDSEYGYDEEDE